MRAENSSRDPAASKLVERQMRNWELARAQRLSKPEPQREEVEDFISVSRCVGAGGQEVASLLGEKLGWPVFDKKILDVMAGDDDLRRQIYASMDERDIGWCEETLRSVMQPGFVKNDYFSRLTETLLSVARQSHGIFLGRGANLVLPRKIGFRVRLVAPLATRIDYLAKRRSVTSEEASEEIKRLERERAEFIRHHFGVDETDPTRCDLLINTGTFTLTQAVEAILSSRDIFGTAD